MQTSMPSFTYQVSLSVLTFTQPVRSLPLKRGLYCGSSAACAAMVLLRINRTIPIVSICFIVESLLFESGSFSDAAALQGLPHSPIDHNCPIQVKQVATAFMTKSNQTSSGMRVPASSRYCGRPWGSSIVTACGSIPRL